MGIVNRLLDLCLGEIDSSESGPLFCNLPLYRVKNKVYNVSQECFCHPTVVNFDVSRYLRSFLLKIYCVSHE